MKSYLVSYGAVTTRSDIEARKLHFVMRIGSSVMPSPRANAQFRGGRHHGRNSFAHSEM